MAELADATDVEASLGRSLTADEAARVDDLLLKASAFVEQYTGRRFTPGDYTVGRKPRNGKVNLPAAVASVSAVRSVDQRDGSEVELTEYTVRNSTVYGLRGVCYAEIEFTVTAAVPDDVVAVVAGVVADLLRSPTVGLTSEMEGGYQAVYDKSSGRVWLAASDKAVLAKYRMVAPSVML